MALWLSVWCPPVPTPNGLLWTPILLWCFFSPKLKTRRRNLSWSIKSCIKTVPTICLHPLSFPPTAALGSGLARDVDVRSDARRPVGQRVLLAASCETRGAPRGAAWQDRAVRRQPEGRFSQDCRWSWGPGHVSIGSHVISQSCHLSLVNKHQLSTRSLSPTALFCLFFSLVCFFFLLA